MTDEYNIENVIDDANRRHPNKMSVARVIRLSLKRLKHIIITLLHIINNSSYESYDSAYYITRFLIFFSVFKL